MTAEKKSAAEAWAKFPESEREIVRTKIRGLLFAIGNHSEMTWAVAEAAINVLDEAAKEPDHER
jgi:hypothetical protein